MCLEDCLTFTISRDRVLQCYYQNPELGFFLIRLVTRRLLHNLEAANFEMAQTLSPGPQRPPTAV